MPYRAVGLAATLVTAVAVEVRDASADDFIAGLVQGVVADGAFEDSLRVRRCPRRSAEPTSEQAPSVHLEGFRLRGMGHGQRSSDEGCAPRAHRNVYGAHDADSALAAAAPAHATGWTCSRAPLGRSVRKHASRSSERKAVDAESQSRWLENLQPRS